MRFHCEIGRTKAYLQNERGGDNWYYIRRMDADFASMIPEALKMWNRFFQHISFQLGFRECGADDMAGILIIHKGRKICRGKTNKNKLCQKYNPIVGMI